MREATVGGTYDGSNGSGTLTFEVTQGGTLGTDDLSVAVFDANNNQIDTINIDSTAIRRSGVCACQRADRIV